MSSNTSRGKDIVVANNNDQGSSHVSNMMAIHHQDQHQHQHHQIRQSTAAPLSRYESQKRRDWNTFCQYLKNQRPPVSVMAHCTPNNVLDFLRYLDQFGKTKVHHQSCVFFGQPEPPGPCTCPLKQAWGSLDALIGRLRAAYEENGGSPETNPFASGVIRLHLREVRDSQAKARGVPYKKKKKRRINTNTNNNNNQISKAPTNHHATSSSSITSTSDCSSSRFSMQSPS